MKGIVRKFKVESNLGSSPFDFVFVTEDGSTLLQSRRYKSKDSAYKGIRAVKKHCITDKYYIFNQGAQEKLSFEIKSSNGVPIVDSIKFSSENEMKNMIKEIKSRIPECDVDFVQNK